MLSALLSCGATNKWFNSVLNNEHTQLLVSLLKKCLMVKIATRIRLHHSPWWWPWPWECQKASPDPQFWTQRPYPPQPCDDNVFPFQHPNPKFQHNNNVHTATASQNLTSLLSIQAKQGQAEECTGMPRKRWLLHQSVLIQQEFCVQSREEPTFQTRRACHPAKASSLWWWRTGTRWCSVRLQHKEGKESVWEPKN